MNWNDEAYRQFFKIRSGMAMPIKDLGRENYPIGYWERKVISDMQELELRVQRYCDRETSKASLVEFMIYVGLTPLLISEIIDWADPKRSEFKVIEAFNLLTPRNVFGDKIDE